MSSLAFDDADKVRHFGDHATHCRRVFEGGATADFIQAESDAVSYTHLDVYKRQLWNRETPQKQGPQTVHTAAGL